METTISKTNLCNSIMNTGLCRNTNIATFVKGGVQCINENDRKLDMFVDVLYNKQIPISLQHEAGKDVLARIYSNISKVDQVLLPLMNIDTSVFTAEPIHSRLDDNKAITAEIRRINRKVACHVCNHVKLEKQQYDYAADILELRKSHNLAVIYKYYRMLAQSCVLLEYYDSDKKMIEKGRTFRDREDDLYNQIVNKEELAKVQQAAVDFNNEVIKIKSKYLITRCPKCEALEKEYHYVIKEVEQMRADEIERQEAEVKRLQLELEHPPIIDFMNKYFNGKERLRISDVVKMWKAVQRIRINQAEMKELLEESGEWKVTNVHNILWVTRL